MAAESARREDKVGESGMRGQWIGNYGGTNTGTAVVDIDI
jgi:hypothetical protein